MALDEEERQFIEDLSNRTQQLQSKNTELSSALAASNYQGQEDKNLIEFQLDTSDMLSKIEHFLKGDYVDVDGEGNEVWKTQQDDTLILFNKYGVNSILLIIGNYIDKNTMLSQYDEMRINEILADLGEELAKFIYCNYEKMGMDTEFKKTRYELTVITILHSIESAYRRAIGGNTSRELNSSRIFTQSDFKGAPSNMSIPKKKFNLFKPRTW